MKPGPAMRHPWILAGRKRAQPAVMDKRTSSSAGTSRSYLPAANGKPGSSSGSKHLVISPPTPLVAKAPPSVMSSASKIGHSMSSSKLSQPMSRTNSFKACASCFCICDEQFDRSLGL